MKKIFQILFFFLLFFIFFGSVQAEEVDFTKISKNKEKLINCLKTNREGFLNDFFLSFDKNTVLTIKPILKNIGIIMKDQGLLKEWETVFFNNREKFMNPEYMALLIQEGETYFSKENLKILADDLEVRAGEKTKINYLALLYAFRINLNLKNIKKTEELLKNNQQLFNEIPRHIFSREMAIFYRMKNEPEKAMLELDTVIDDYELKWKDNISNNKSGNSEYENVKIEEFYIVNSKILKAEIAFENKYYNTCLIECTELLTNYKEKLIVAAELKLNSLLLTKQYEKIFKEYNELITYFKGFSNKLRLFLPYSKALLIEKKHIDILSQVRQIGTYQEYTSNKELLLILFSAAFREKLEVRITDYFLKLSRFNVQKNPEYLYTKCKVNRKSKNYIVWFKVLKELEKIDKIFYNREIKYYFNAKFYYNLKACRWHRAIEWAKKSLKSAPDQPELSGLVHFMSSLIGEKTEFEFLIPRIESSGLLGISFLIHREKYSQAIDKIDKLINIYSKKKTDENVLIKKLKKTKSICVFLNTNPDRVKIEKFIKKNNLDSLEVLFLIDQFYYKIPEIAKTLFQQYLVDLKMLKKINYIDYSKIENYKYLIIKPSFASVLLKFASNYLEEKEDYSPAAEKILNMVFKSEPTDLEKANAWYGLSLEKFKKGEMDLSLKNIDLALRINSENRSFLLHKIKILFTNNEYETAEILVNKINFENFSPLEMARILIMKGRINEKIKKFDKALNEYEKALSFESPLNDMINHRIANIYFNLGETQKVSDFLEKIKDKKSINYLFSKGLILKSKGLYKEAANYFKNAIDNEKKLQKDLEREYILCLSVHNPMESEKYLNENKKKLIKLSDYYPLKSLVLIRGNKIKEGLDILNREIPMHSFDDDAVYFTIAAYAYLEGGEPEKTLSLLKKIDNDKEKLYLQGYSLIKLSRFEEALKILKKNSYKANASILYLHALALYMNNKKELAINFIKKSDLSEKVKSDFIQGFNKIKNQ